MNNVLGSPVILPSQGGMVSPLFPKTRPTPALEFVKDSRRGFNNRVAGLQNRVSTNSNNIGVGVLSC